MVVPIPARGPVLVPVPIPELEPIPVLVPELLPEVEPELVPVPAPEPIPLPVPVLLLPLPTVPLAAVRALSTALGPVRTTVPVSLRGTA